eukprot:365041-Chlamydomonas_euryale.AAC.14
MRRRADPATALEGRAGCAGMLIPPLPWKGARGTQARQSCRCIGRARGVRRRAYPAAVLGERTGLRRCAGPAAAHDGWVQAAKGEMGGAQPSLNPKP